MRDGVTLSADVYRPSADGRFPVILTRTPYLKSPRDKEGLERCRYFASRGYVFVVADVRGRGDSGGTFVPYREDGPRRLRRDRMVQPATLVDRQSRHPRGLVHRQEPVARRASSSPRT